MNLEVNKKRNIECMEDFSNLFLSIYSLKKYDGNSGKIIYMSKYISDILKNIMDNYNINEGLADDKGMFDINRFLKIVRYSKLKTYFKTDFKFDLEKDEIYTQVDIDKMEEEIDKYDDISRKSVELIVEELIKEEKNIKMQDKKSYSYISKCAL